MNHVDIDPGTPHREPPPTDANGPSPAHLSVLQALRCEASLPDWTEMLLLKLTELEAITLTQRMPSQTELRAAYLARIAELLTRLALQARSGLHVRGPYLIPALGDCLLLQACIDIGIGCGETCLHMGELAQLGQGWMRFFPTEPEWDILSRYAAAIALGNESPADAIPLSRAGQLIGRFVDEVIGRSSSLDWSSGIRKTSDGWWCHEEIRDLLFSPADLFHWMRDTGWFAGDALWHEDWGALMRLERRWREMNDFELDYDRVEHMSEWPCDVARYYKAWHATLPCHLEYCLVPLTSRDALEQEASELNNICDCFWQICARGEARKFSIQSSRSRRRIGTLEIGLNFDTLVWESHGINAVSDETLDFDSLPEGETAKRSIDLLTQSALDWYNRDTKDKNYTFRFEFVATVDAAGHLTTLDDGRSIYCLTLRNITPGDELARYVGLCLERGLVLLGPGHAGPWPACEKELFDDACPRRKIADIQRFAESMQAGDTIILRDGLTILATGEIVGGYEWLPGHRDIGGWGMQHSRRVRWMPHNTPPVFRKG